MDTIERRQACKKRGASFIIIFVLLSQGLAIIGSIERFGWPFVNYPMYSQPRHFEGDAVNRYFLYGTLEAGVEVLIRDKDLKLDPREFIWGPVEDILKDRVDSLKHYIALYQKLYGQRLISLKLENHPVTLMADGLREELPATVKIIRVIDEVPQL